MSTTGLVWSPDELRLVADNQHTTAELTALLDRTHEAIYKVRYKLKRGACIETWGIRTHNDPRGYARRLLGKAISDGQVTRSNVCAACKQPAVRPLDGHHWHGYDDPLDVQWLCHSCHQIVHGGPTGGHGVQLIQRHCSCRRTMPPGGMGQHLKANPDHRVVREERLCASSD